MTKISKQNYTFVQQRGRGNPKPNNPYKILFVKSKRVQKNTKIQTSSKHMVSTHARASGTRQFVTSCKLQ